MLGTKSEAKKLGENVVEKVFLKKCSKNFERKMFRTKLCIKLLEIVKRLKQNFKEIVITAKNFGKNFEQKI
jgi:hypothetical protein